MKRVSLAPLKNISFSSAGLTDIEVQQQRELFGTNNIIDSGKSRWNEIFSDTVRDPMMWFLGGVSLLFFVVGQATDAIVLLVAIIPLAFMDAFLHWRTKSAVNSLKGNLSRQAKVIRSGKELTINSEDVVPGDLLKLGSGDIISADGIIVSCADIQINESALTGESLPVKKKKSEADLSKLADEVSLDNAVVAFAGTKVLAGEAVIRITATGHHTEYGGIAKSVSETPHERTPLQVSIGKLVKVLLLAAVFFCFILVGIRLYQGHHWLDSILVGLTLAVAAMPEEFPVVFSFFLGVGIFRLAKKQALVRRAVSVENVGRITHICTDKTGTITFGAVMLAHVVPFEAVEETAIVTAALAAGEPKNGDPVDVAIQAFAEKQNVRFAGSPTYRFPFTEDRKKETVIIETQDGAVAYSKGAPEKILGSSVLSDPQKKVVRQKITELAQTGHKVLACARLGLKPNLRLKEEPISGFEFLGLLAFEDPARPEVRRAIEGANQNGIKVIMITGDHPATAASIARDVGLGGSTPQVMSAEEFPEKFDSDFLSSHSDFINSLDVVARCTPKQKLNIVLALKARGHIVAVTGDGINDVPALKAADVGIAMGERGSQTAKEVSSIILLDDNFKTIVAAIEEGRQLFQNLRTAFEYLLLIHFPLVLSAALLPLVGYPILFLPIHIVWLELIIHPSAILAFQSSAEKGILQPLSSFFNRRDSLLISVAGIAGLAIVSVLFVSALAEFGEEVARTEVLAALSLWSAGTVLALSNGGAKTAKVISFATALMSFVVIQFGGTLHKFFHVYPLSMDQWLKVLIPVATATLLLWYFKHGYRLRKQFVALNAAQS